MIIILTFYVSKRYICFLQLIFFKLVTKQISLIILRTLQIERWNTKIREQNIFVIKKRFKMLLATTISLSAFNYNYLNWFLGSIHYFSSYVKSYNHLRYMLAYCCFICRIQSFQHVLFYERIIIIIHITECTEIQYMANPTKTFYRY